MDARKTCLQSLPPAPRMMARSARTFFFFLSRVNKTLTVTVNNPWLGIIALIRRGTSNAVLFCLSRWDFSPAPPRLRGLLLCSGLRAEEDKIRIMMPVSSRATWRLWLRLVIFFLFFCRDITAHVASSQPCRSPLGSRVWAGSHPVSRPPPYFH